MVNLTSRPIYAGIQTGYPLNRRLGEPHSRYGHFGTRRAHRRYTICMQKFWSGILKGRSLLEESVGERGGAVGWSTALQPTRLRVRFPMASMTQPFRPHYDPGIDSASIRNEYQEYFLEDKGGRCVDVTNLPPWCADCLEIWMPQPSETLRFTVPDSKERRSHPAGMCFVRWRLLPINHLVYITDVLQLEKQIIYCIWNQPV